MGAGMYPSPCIPCCLNQGLTEAARRIVDLEEERDALKARVEQLTTDLQTAHQERDDALGRATLAERRAIQAEGRVRALREALENIEKGGLTPDGRALTPIYYREIARAALSATDEGKGDEP